MAIKELDDFIRQGVKILVNEGYTRESAQEYMEAYRYIANNPTDFDSAWSWFFEKGKMLKRTAPATK